jgi:hypothetical protein
MDELHAGSGKINSKRARLPDRARVNHFHLNAQGAP